MPELPEAESRFAADTLLDLPSRRRSRAGSNMMPLDMDPPWKQMLDSLPLGTAILDADSGQTLWTNSALNDLLTIGIGRRDVIGQTPAQYLPGMNRAVWEQTMRGLSDRSKTVETAEKANIAQRIQLVDHATRNIAYWEWTAQTVDTPTRFLMLTIQGVTEVVLNERLLASASHKAERARDRAEALVRLTQVVNASLTIPDLLRAITQEAATYFDAHSAAMFLLESDGEHFHTGYSIGLESQSDRVPALLNCGNTLSGRALTQRQTLVVLDPVGQGIQTPLLDIGTPPVTIVSSPIFQNEHNYGVVEVYFTERRDISTDARSLLAAFAQQTAVALHKAELYHQITEQRRQLQSIFDNAPVGIIYFEPGGHAIAVNAAAGQKYGRPISDIVGHPYSDFLVDMPANLFAHVREGHSFHASHYVYEIPGQGEAVCDVSLLPVRDEGGQVVGLLLLNFDVTELVKARQEADVAREAAESALVEVRAAQSQMVQMEKMRAIGELASGVAHDFNNALMAILGYTELAEDSLKDPESLASHLAIIRQAAEDATATVRRLQRFARRGMPTNGQPTDLNVIVKDVISLTRPQWKDAAQKEGRTYDVKMHLQPELPLIAAEPSGLREVLLNLVHNALNAMREGGNLILSTRRRGEKEVEIEVEDTGIGMTPEVQKRIFDPFFTTRGVEGTGLGLAVSWTIIQRHGGTIEVESQSGIGTRFFLRFPVSEGEIPSYRPVRKEVPAPKPGVSLNHLLVVDDEPFIAGVLTSILSRHGYRVTTVSSALEALEKLKETDQAFQLVLTDHGMPGMTGLQMIPEIKKEHPTMPVVLLTGWGESLLQNNIVDIVPDAILGKPINQADLLDAVASEIRKAEERALAAKTTGNSPPDTTEEKTARPSPE